MKSMPEEEVEKLKRKIADLECQIRTCITLAGYAGIDIPNKDLWYQHLFGREEEAQQRVKARFEDLIAELKLMIDIFRVVIETYHTINIVPAVNSPCYNKILELLDRNVDGQLDYVKEEKSV